MRLLVFRARHTRNRSLSNLHNPRLLASVHLACNALVVIFVLALPRIDATDSSARSLSATPQDSFSVFRAEPSVQSVSVRSESFASDSAELPISSAAKVLRCPESAGVFGHKILGFQQVQLSARTQSMMRQ